jgi:rubrerythrin
MKIGDYLVDVKPSPQMTFQDLLIIAIKRETAARDLYTDLAGSLADPTYQALLTALAQEESTHKLKFETAYDEHFMSEN